MQSPSTLALHSNAKFLLVLCTLYICTTSFAYYFLIMSLLLLLSNHVYHVYPLCLVCHCSCTVRYWSSLVSLILCFALCADACQVLAKFMMHLYHTGILLTRVKLVLTPGVQLGN